jgi:hypothetical protein
MVSVRLLHGSPSKSLFKEAYMLFSGDAAVLWKEYISGSNWESFKGLFIKENSDLTFKGGALEIHYSEPEDEAFAVVIDCSVAD